MEEEKKKKSFMMFYDWEPLFLFLDDEDVGALFKALFAYEIRDEWPKYEDLDDSVWGVFKYLAARLDENRKHWETKSNAGSIGGKKSGETRRNKAKADAKQNEADAKQTRSKTKQNEADTNENEHKDKDKDKDKDNVLSSDEDKNNIGATKSRVFVPPTVEEVQAYCLERQNTVDPEAFVAFYNSNGWLVGKNKMKNWKSAVITWEKRQDKQTTSAQTDTGLTDWYKIAQEVEDEQRNNGASYVDIFAGIPATVREDVGG